MKELVIWSAVAVAALNALAALIGLYCWYFGSEGRGFWLTLRIGQIAAILYALEIGVVVASGHHPSEELFYLYALLPIAVALIAEQLRLAAAQIVLAKSGFEDAQEVAQLAPEQQLELARTIMRRELGVMALSALVVVVLALRAASTAHGF